MVKVRKTELLQIETRKQIIYLEQEFKLTKKTNFETLKDMCCDFWGLESNNYSLYDTKFGHLMALNANEHHPAHSVSDYFEVLKMRNPSLFLLRNEREKTKPDDEQKKSAIIDKKNLKLAEHEFENQEKRQNKEEKALERNLDKFNKLFPGQKKYQLRKKKRSSKVDIAYLPNTYFLTCLCNFLLIASVLVFFFNTRDVSEVYYIRKTVDNVF